jgi:4-amino-4-deoxy-L-arabinose transferase-like glycosyltransferase
MADATMPDATMPEIAAPDGAGPDSAVTGTDPGGPVGGPIGGPMSRRRFGMGLTGIVVAALGFRVGYVLIVTRHENNKLYDSFWYAITGLELASHQFFRSPLATTPTAAHPPLTSLLLAPATYFFGFNNDTTPQRLTMALLGAAVVLCVGLLGRAVAGPWVGLTAALLAACYPNFWIPNGILMSETPAMLGMALILLAVMRVRRSPTVPSAILLGAACGAEALVRAELVLFVPLLLAPALLAARPASAARKFGLLGIGVLGAALVMAPWVGRNLATFQDPTYLSTGNGGALLGANCPATYGGPHLGSWSLVCAVSVTAHGDESVQSAVAQNAAVKYAENHAGRLPVVVAARIGRLWDFYEPMQMADFDVNEGRPRDASVAGLVMYYALLPLGLAGIVILRRRRGRPWFLLVPAGVLTVVAGVFYGLVRFRAPFEVCLVVLAAPPVVLTAQRLGRGLSGLTGRGRQGGRRAAVGEV